MIDLGEMRSRRKCIAVATRAGLQSASRADIRAIVRRAREWRFRHPVKFRCRRDRSSRILADAVRALPHTNIATSLGRTQSQLSNLKLGIRKVDSPELQKAAAAHDIVVERLLAEPRFEREREALTSRVPPLSGRVDRRADRGRATSSQARGHRFGRSTTARTRAMICSR